MRPLLTLASVFFAVAACAAVEFAPAEFRPWGYAVAASAVMSGLLAGLSALQPPEQNDDY